MRIWAFCLVSVLALSGCRTFWDPTFMPAGYAYHQEEFKSPPGPEAEAVGYEYDASVNAAVQDEFELALRDLLLKAKANDIVLPQTISLRTDMTDSSFQGTIDFVLREILKDYGYTLAPADQPETPALFYSAYVKDPYYNSEGNSNGPYIGSPDGPEDPKYKQDHENFTLVLGLLEEKKQNIEITQHVASEYSLPYYGYKASYYQYVPGYKYPVRSQQYQELNP